MQHLRKLAFIVLFGFIAVQTLQVPTAYGQGKPVVVVRGNITANTTFSSANDYLLSGAVFVQPPATLTIEAGTTIFGESAANGTLVIAQGARIMAVGTANAPIVFTTDQPAGSRSRGLWGGVIINGRAPLNVPGGQAFGEGDTGVYGGSQPNDDSGVLKYVRVEFAGTEFSPDNELNGIALQGVGRGTEVDFVQVHFNLDDCIEFFGGTADAKHVVCTDTGDDNLDWTEGWTGRVQFFIAQQRGDDADQGIEADNNAENNNLQPRANPKIYNVTLIGDPTNKKGGESDLGMLLREGTAGTIANAIVLGFKEKGLEIDHAATFQQASQNKLVVKNSIFWQNGVNFSDDSDEDPPPPFTTAQFAARSQSLVVIDPRLRKPYNYAHPDFRPQDGSPAVDGTVKVALPPNDGFFEPVTFIGALSNVASEDWTQGWTRYVQK